ncbi:hypothetical protein AB0C13_18790 [Streptomyces sp. NPDC049099]|uniref:hypothetical protein n=1 Tax=Streptomyces sp. NPDC049099 TaxID=3155768 RepID=UPI003415CB78
MPPPKDLVFRLADYLEQHGRTTRRHLCPPASFWHAAHTHLTHPDDLNNLAEAAEDRHRLQWGHHLLQRAADHGNPSALVLLAERREKAGDRDGAEDFYRQAADHGNTSSLYHLARRPDNLNRLWPHGLDPDGTPTSPWQPSVSVKRGGHVPPGTS